MPPSPVPSFYYTCGAQFHTTPLRELAASGQDVYGIVNIDAGEAAIALLRGCSLKLLKAFQSGIAGKHGKGGSSQGRMMRLHGEHVLAFCRYVAGKVDKFLLPVADLMGVIIGGAGMTKELFAKDGQMDYRLREKVITIVDTGYSGFNGIRETFQRAKNTLANLRYVKERDVVQKFMHLVVTNSSLATYGIEETRSSVRQGRAGSLLLSEALPAGTSRELIADANVAGTTITYISPDSEDGEMFFETFGGVGAILRF